MKLSADLAQTIVNKMMAQIPYNVNMMDDQGYIIASGDVTRLNTLHVGAVKAIQQQKTLPMYHAYGHHGQPGVNMPVFFNQQIVGVIGITGDPDKVTPLASLLRVATELLLQQSQDNQRQQQRENELQRLLYQWINVPVGQPLPTELTLAAHQLHLNLTLPRQAIALATSDLPTTLLEASDLRLSLTAQVTIVLTTTAATVQRLTTYARTAHILLGIGETALTPAQSVQQARQTLHLNQQLHRPDLINFSQIRFQQLLLDGHLALDPLVTQFRELARTATGQELIQTLTVYIAHNGNVTQTAKVLHAHRNTLIYRLHKLQDYFGRDPHQDLERFELYLGLLYFRTTN
ncbi:sugar diacid recognition domain-containing protein [Levilactobacillus zymae]|uniref:CdaR family transcriptional regulator n=1 Tax=Levilactobacillus zymae TaxID=267363 RepID=UPI0028B6E8FA|nr:sugar diacid recognition domain-containing protein [Levilactobacillus zymae]MDT6981272.1 sugar diacid recognition domain-containing protein [Levilactobacillus zymae]